MINLFDNYSQETRDLHLSLKKAGYDIPTIVIDANGFLPEGVISPYTYFLNNQKDTVRGCFFNEVPVPDFWEIHGDGSSATIHNYEKEQGRIQYHTDSNNRIVEFVEWLDDQGRLYQIDRYDKFGNLFAKTTVNTEGQHLITTYLDANNKEVIVENLSTGDIILSLENEPLLIFHGKVDFIKFFITYVGLDQSHIFYNTLSYSFLVSHYSNEVSGSDILFWQEPIANEIPGNMSLILNSDSHRTKKIVIPNHETYQRALELVDEDKKHRFASLGYIYDFKRENNGHKDAFIFTNSDQIEGLAVLAEKLPEMKIRVAARTEMSPALMSMVKYPNIMLYQNIDQERIDEVFAECDILLDINYYSEVMNATRQAFENNMLILSFSQLLHNSRYVAKDAIFDKNDVDGMISKIQTILADKAALNHYLEQQRQQADALSVEAFRTSFDIILGEL